MSFPLPFTASLWRWVPDALDAHRNVTNAWQDGVEIACFWWVPESTEPALPGHNRVIVDATLVVDSTMAIGPRDRLWLPFSGGGLFPGFYPGAHAAPGGVEAFEVMGWPQDFDHGPFGWSPNRRPVALKRVEG